MVQLLLGKGRPMIVSFSLMIEWSQVQYQNRHFAINHTARNVRQKMITRRIPLPCVSILGDINGAKDVGGGAGTEEEPTIAQQLFEKWKDSIELVWNRQVPLQHIIMNFPEWRLSKKNKKVLRQVAVLQPTIQSLLLVSCAVLLLIATLCLSVLPPVQIISQ